MNDFFNIKETIIKRDDEDYPDEYIYDTSGACTIKSVWTDHENSFWMESNDGQRVIIPREIRNLIAKRIKETKFKL